MQSKVFWNVILATRFILFSKKNKILNDKIYMFEITNINTIFIEKGVKHIKSLKTSSLRLFQDICITSPTINAQVQHAMDL